LRKIPVQPRLRDKPLGRLGGGAAHGQMSGDWLKH